MKSIWTWFLLWSVGVILGCLLFGGYLLVSGPHERRSTYDKAIVTPGLRAWPDTAHGVICYVIDAGNGTSCVKVR